MTEKDYELAKETFDKYYKNYEKLSFDIDRKYKHSLKVADLMEELAKRLGLSKEDIILAKTIGLLHDIGRFEQLKQTNSFSDREFDHAKYAVTYLFDLNHIVDFIKSRDYDFIIKNAIVDHNKYSISDGLDERTIMFCKMIRDMDKTDIYAQEALNYHDSFDGKITKEVEDEFNKNVSIHRINCNTQSDIVLSMMAFLFDYGFDESFDILVETDNFGFWISTIEVEKHVEEKFKDLVNKCYLKIERGV